VASARVLGRTLTHFGAPRAPEGVDLRDSYKKRTPTATGALVEVLLVLAVGIVVIGVCRGWFTYGGDSGIKATSGSNAQPMARIAAARVDSEDSDKSPRDLQ
jgi:hypothetical protein